ncbi:hypothetical protein GU926_14710 [Nibribacter ruber]|uniref:Uncharacterized protein n=1 Tax=Nibribacter ruber TaxID=2698458 RepID=A0A6P1P2J7_9BACT|nr:hypothetical protein [Nibribacter ruber]QHL88611.1 hypothetical protein GU926_14710 [Nibribacter ruber]
MRYEETPPLAHEVVSHGAGACQQWQAFSFTTEEKPVVFGLFFRKQPKNGFQEAKEEFD